MTGIESTRKTNNLKIALQRQGRLAESYPIPVVKKYLPAQGLAVR